MTVTIPTIGPVLALSLAGTESVESGPSGVPELTGKLERTAGACVNVHMMYPALVYGFWHVFDASWVPNLAPVTDTVPVGGASDHGDHALRRDNEPAAELQRYHDALTRLSERDGIRTAPSRHEACGLTVVVRSDGSRPPMAYPQYPPSGSLLGYNRMFERLYALHDRRFVNSTRALSRRHNGDSGVASRRCWLCWPGGLTCWQRCRRGWSVTQFCPPLRPRSAGPPWWPACPLPSDSLRAWSRWTGVKLPDQRGSLCRTDDEEQ